MPGKRCADVHSVTAQVKDKTIPKLAAYIWSQDKFLVSSYGFADSHNESYCMYSVKNGSPPSAPSKICSTINN